MPGNCSRICALVTVAALLATAPSLAAADPFVPAATVEFPAGSLPPVEETIPYVVRDHGEPVAVFVDYRDWLRLLARADAADRLEALAVEPVVAPRECPAGAQWAYVVGGGALAVVVGFVGGFVLAGR